MRASSCRKNYISFVPKVESLERLSLVSALDFGLLGARRGATPDYETTPSLQQVQVGTARFGMTQKTLVPHVDQSTATISNLAYRYVAQDEPIIVSRTATTATPLSSLIPFMESADIQTIVIEPNVITVPSQPISSDALHGGNLTTPGVDQTSSSPVAVGQGSQAQSSGLSSIQPTSTTVTRTVTPIADNDGVRPMAVAPKAGVGSSSSSRMSPDVCGGNPVVYPQPGLFFSGGGVGATQITDGSGNPIPGQYQAQKPIPIGTIITVQATGLNAGGSPTELWGGGTDYQTYFASSSSDSAPTAVRLVKNVDPTQQTYQFIVDSNPRDYTIQVHITYNNGQEFAETVKFTSIAPKANIALTPTQPNQTLTINNDGTATVGMAAPIGFLAQGSTPVGAGGVEMFMQVVNSAYMSYTSSTGNALYRKNNMTIDNQNYNGPLHDGATLAYPNSWTTDNNPQAGPYTGWTVRSGSSLPDATLGYPVMGDTVAYNPAGANPQKVTETAKFSTYIMYQAYEGDWIAIAEADWTMTETATIQGGQLTGPTTEMSKPTTSTPSGDAAFPTWVNSAQAFQDSTYAAGDPGA